MQNYRLQLTLALPRKQLCTKNLSAQSQGKALFFFTAQLTTDVEVPFDKNVWNKCKATHFFR